MVSPLDKLISEFQLPLESPILIFSLILFIILLAPLILGRFKIPGIIGLIIAGIIIGPKGLNILGESLFVDVFSTIGLLYIMFIAGLELDLTEFKAHKKQSLLFSFFTFMIPLSIGMVVCFYFLKYGFFTSLLTASMFATHTLVTYPIVNKFGVAKNPAVAITVGATIVTDTMVLMLLAVILGAHEGGLSQQFWIRLGISIALFSAFMFFVIPRIAKWFFTRMESEKYSHYIFLLAVVFLAAFLAEIAGLEDIIGAFFAGLALNRLIPSSSALMNRVEFIGNSLFIPFFLISVGMLVDISVILEGPMALIVAGSLTVVALSGKWLAAWVTQLVYKYTKNQRRIIFGLSGAHAAATLAVIKVGFDAHIIDDNILNGTVILILITCLIASFVTEKAAKDIIKESRDETTTKSKAEYESILIPIANTVNLRKLMDFAVLIKDPDSENPLTVLTVVPNTAAAEKQIVKAKEESEDFVKEAAASETEVNFKATIDHNVGSGISRTAREEVSDIILLGWPQTQGFLDKIIGDRVTGILAQTKKTLLICDLKKKLLEHKRLFVIVPPNAEFEEGFPLWLNKLMKLSKELSVPVHLNSTKKTYESILRYADQNKMKFSLEFHEYSLWEDFSGLTKNIKQRDFLIMISSRKGYVSHYHYLDGLPAKLERHFDDQSKIIVYPQ